MSEEDRRLRRGLRVHGRQRSDLRNAGTGEQVIDQLVRRTASTTSATTQTSRRRARRPLLVALPKSERRSATLAQDLDHIP